MVGERVLLAGCGDLGLRVAQRLRARGDEVWALRRTPPVEADAGIHWVRADLTVARSLQQLPAGLTQLVYLPTPDRRDACAYGALFADGLRNLLAATGMATLQRVLLVSSSAVYGEHGGAWVDEGSPTSTLAFNGTVLRDVEQWLAAQPVRSIVLRLAGLYGPGRLQLLERLRAGLVTVPRSAQHWANRMHVDRCCCGHCACVASGRPAARVSGGRRHAAAAGCPVRPSGAVDRRAAATRRAGPGWRREQAVEQRAIARERFCAAMAGCARRVRGVAGALNGFVRHRGDAGFRLQLALGVSSVPVVCGGARVASTPLSHLGRHATEVLAANHGSSSAACPPVVGFCRSTDVACSTPLAWLGAGERGGSGSAAWVAADFAAGRHAAPSGVAQPEIDHVGSQGNRNQCLV